MGLRKYFVSGGIFLCVIAGAAAGVQAAPPSYAQVKKLPFAAARMLADPVRPRVYATLRDQNSLLVIDTTTLETSTMAIGSSPFGLAMSPDGSRLYVANTGSTTAGIAVVDLDTLTKLPVISTSVLPLDVAVGADGVLFLTPSSTSGSLMRLDTKSGITTTFASNSRRNGFLQISPDLNTLYFADHGPSPGTVQKFDVSVTPPQLLQSHSNGGSVGNDLKLSHDGTFLASPSGAGNGPGYSTAVIPTANLNAVIGTLEIGAYPTMIAFSFNDQVAYHVAYSQNHIHIFDLSTFNETATVQVAPETGVGSFDYSDITAEPSNHYLFVASANSSVIYVYDVAPGPDRSYPLNISTRLQVGSGDSVAVAGFITKGGPAKRLLIRGLGPSLHANGIAHPIADPEVELHNTEGRFVSESNDWKVTNDYDAIVATGLQPSDDLESAILVSDVQEGSYTAILRNRAGTPGIGLIEVYDLDAQPASSKLANISTRGWVGIGNNVMIGGFILGGNGDFSSTVVVRAIAPSLIQAGVQGALADPLLQLFDANGVLLATNDNWKDGQPAEIEQVGLQPTNDAESAILSVLNPGAYTAIVRGAHNGAGVGLIEIYNLQQ